MLSNNMHADWEDTMIDTTFGHRLIKLRILFTPCGKIVIYHVIEGEPIVVATMIRSPGQKNYKFL